MKKPVGNPGVILAKRKSFEVGLVVVDRAGLCRGKHVEVGIKKVEGQERNAMLKGGARLRDSCKSDKERKSKFSNF